jgi:hypothetical protein
MRTFLHSGARGDIVYSLPTVKQLGGGILYIQTTGEYCVGEGSTDIKDTDVINFKELLVRNSYIEDVKIWNGEEIRYNLNDFRTKGGNFFITHLAKVHLNAFGEQFDLSKPWLEEDKYERKYLSDIIINYSIRYPGKIQNWDVLKEYEEKITFIGFESEHQQFCKNNNLNLKFHKVSSFLEIAEIVLAAKLYIGNQSFIYSIAEAFKVPRTLSVYPQAPNCGPTYNAYDFLRKDLIEKWI